MKFIACCSMGGNATRDLARRQIILDLPKMKTVRVSCMHDPSKHEGWPSNESDWGMEGGRTLVGRRLKKSGLDVVVGWKQSRPSMSFEEGGRSRSDASADGNECKSPRKLPSN